MLSSLERRRRLYAIFFVLGSLLWVYYLFAAVDWSVVSTLDVRMTEVQGRMDRAEGVLAHAPGVERRLSDVRMDLYHRFRDQLAPADSPLSWINRRLQAAAKAAGLRPNEIDIIMLSGIDSPWAQDPQMRDVAGKVSVRVALTSAPEPANKLVGYLEKQESLATVSKIFCLPVRPSPQRQFSIVVEWPQWLDTVDARHVAEQFVISEPLFL